MNYKAETAAVAVAACRTSCRYTSLRVLDVTGQLLPDAGVVTHGRRPQQSRLLLWITY